MKDRDDDDPRGLIAVQNGVGEPLDEQPPDLAFDPRMHVRLGLDASNGGTHLDEVLVSEPLALALVPGVCLGYVDLGLLDENERPHERLRQLPSPANAALDFVPASPTDALPIESVKAALQLRALSRSERHLVRRQAVPELLDQLESLLRCEVGDVDGWVAHEGSLTQSGRRFQCDVSDSAHPGQPGATTQLRCNRTRHCFPSRFAWIPSNTTSSRPAAAARIFPRSA